MEYKKVKVLGIAPYKGMKIMMERLAQTRSDLDLTVYVGDLNKGVEIVKENLHNNYDVIISRGGTAEMIRKITNIPLVEITLSVYDILRAIKLAENYTGQYAIVGYHGITSSAQLLCDLLQYNIDINTVHNINEVVHVISKLKDENYQMVLCDMITNTTAQQLGLNSILITSGDESIESSFDQAVKLYKSYASIKEQNKLLQSVITQYNENILIFEQNRQLILSSADKTYATAFEEIALTEFDESLQTPTRKFVKSIEDHSFEVTSQLINNTSSISVIYRFKESQKISTSCRRPGIFYSNKNEIESSFYNSFYSIASPIKDSKDEFYLLSINDSPIMILGESGLGKSMLAGSLYITSKNSNNPFITLNCNLIDNKAWHFLLDHYNSPLTDSGNTLYFQDIHKLSQEQGSELIMAIINTNVHKRNRLIMSFSTNDKNAQADIANEYINKLSCLIVNVDPLRDHVQDIPKMSSLYINSLNLELAKSIIGFDQEAMEIMKTYDWPNNYTQFKRLLKEMAIMTQTPYITEKTVRSIIAKEYSTFTTSRLIIPDNESTFNYMLDTNLSLNEINQKIIKLYVEKANGNLTLASKQLGISRTTLWRYMK